MFCSWQHCAKIRKSSHFKLNRQLPQIPLMYSQSDLWFLQQPIKKSPTSKLEPPVLENGKSCSSSSSLKFKSSSGSSLSTSTPATISPLLHPGEFSNKRPNTESLLKLLMETITSSRPWNVQINPIQPSFLFANVQNFTEIVCLWIRIHFISWWQTSIFTFLQRAENVFFLHFLCYQFYIVYSMN